MDPNLPIVSQGPQPDGWESPLIDSNSGVLSEGLKDCPTRDSKDSNSPYNTRGRPRRRQKSTLVTTSRGTHLFSLCHVFIGQGPRRVLFPNKTESYDVFDTVRTVLCRRRRTRRVPRSVSSVLVSCRRSTCVDLGSGTLDSCRGRN